MEVCFAAYVHHRFVNRGFLSGPICPMYGAGMIFAILLLSPVKSNYFLLFLGGVVVCTVVEFITGWLLEKAFKTRWWDYSDKKFNVMGYVCLSYSLFWGVGVSVLILFVHTFTERVTAMIPETIQLILASALSAIFLADALTSVFTALRLNERLAQMQDILVSLLENTEDLRLRGQNALTSTIDELQDELSKKRDELNTALEKLNANTTLFQRRLIRAFPRAKTKSFADALDEFKARFEIKRK